MTHDVVIIGGGPGGTTVGVLLKKYNPELSVLILEKERFPRDHVGESQLPSVSHVLDEMGCWDKVEAANFPIKIGASLTWGQSGEPWDFDFFPAEEFIDEPRPAKFEGQRRYTAFQVDRAVYDDILLRHAVKMGVEVREQTKVDSITRDGDKVVGLELSTGETVSGRWYVDASGSVAILRRAFGVECDAPQELRNIAIWDYWDNAEWAIEIGVGATRVVVRSLAYGWIWFIPLGPTRTSIGLITPASYYRDRGVSAEKLYREALESHPQIRDLIKNAQPEGNVQTTKDWSHVADRVVGENWFLTGEASGFADPILAAGMALCHATARDVAYTILELERGDLGPDWLCNRYNDKTRTAIRQHIRFAQFWYSSNGRFEDLQDQCAKIAKEAGLRLSPQQAWRWLAQGGFVNHSVSTPQLGSFDVFSAQRVIERLSGKKHEAALEKNNVLKLNLHGAEKTMIGEPRNGRIEQIECYVKGEHQLPIAPPYDNVVKILEKTDSATDVIKYLQTSIAAQLPPDQRESFFQQHLQALETMILDGWIIAKHDKKRGSLTMNRAAEQQIRDESESIRAIEEAKRKREADSNRP